MVYHLNLQDLALLLKLCLDVPQKKGSYCKGGIILNRFMFCIKNALPEKSYITILYSN